MFSRQLSQLLRCRAPFCARPGTLDLGLADIIHEGYDVLQLLQGILLGDSRLLELIEITAPPELEAVLLLPSTDQNVKSMEQRNEAAVM